MNLIKVADLSTGKGMQDGAIFGNYLFRLFANGHLVVFDVSALGKSDDVISIPPIGGLSDSSYGWCHTTFKYCGILDGVF